MDNFSDKKNRKHYFWIRDFFGRRRYCFAGDVYKRPSLISTFYKSIYFLFFRETIFYYK